MASYRVSSGKKNKITCRVCGDVTLFQNYKVHIQRNHPDEDCNDLRSKTDKSVSCFFTKPTGSKPSVSGSHDKMAAIVEAIDVDVSDTEQSKEAAPGAKIEEFESAPELPVEKQSDQAKLSDQNELLNLILNKIEKLSHQPAETHEVHTGAINISTHTTTDYIMQECRSIAEITSRFSEFAYDKSTSIMQCKICKPGSDQVTSKLSKGSPASFYFDSSQGDNFNEKLQPEKFRSFKRNLKFHLQTILHTSLVKEETEKSKTIAIHDKREKIVGMRIGRICYHLAKHGRSDKDFPRLILLETINGTDLGDINHSEQFPAKLLPYLSKEVKSRVKEFLNNRLKQTGHKPIGQISADKATWKHRTRQFVTLTTVIPNSENLIQTFFLGHPVVKEHKGRAICESIVNCLSDYDFNKEQYMGSVFDGAYFTLHVPEYLDEYYGYKDEPRPRIWDPLHKAGLQDTHMRKDPKFKWLVDHTKTIGTVFKLFNWGKEFEHFFDVAADIEQSHEVQLEFKMPVFYSETRFANSVKKVYSSFRQDFPALVRTLEENQANLKDKTAKDKQKARESATLSNQIYNLKFACILSGLCDIYEVYGHGVNILQTVNMLPHIKYDKFQMHVLERMERMVEAIDDDDCSKCLGSECLWPLFHGDLREIKTTQSYRGLPITHQFTVSEECTRAGQRREAEMAENTEASTITQSKVMIKCALNYLKDNLSEHVFDDKTMKLITILRNLLDLETLALKLKLRGSAMVAALDTQTFIDNSLKLVTNIRDIPIPELRLQYKEFLNKLELVTSEIDEDDLDSSKLLIMFLETGRGLYKDIEIIIFILCTAAISMTVESVIESHVSIYESRNNKFRPISEERAEHEMQIAVNGPELVHADKVIRAAMNDYWKSSKQPWHFVRRSQNVKDYMESRVIDKFKRQKPDLPFME